MFDCSNSLLQSVRSLSYLRWLCETLRLPKSCDLLPFIAATGELELCKWALDEADCTAGPPLPVLSAAIRAAARIGAARPL